LKKIDIFDIYLYLNKLSKILLLVALVLGACRPKKTVEPAPVVPPAETKSPFTCAELPPTPVPFGWTDSTTNVNENINAFMYNPANPDEVLVVVNGDIQGYNKLFCYNIRTGKKTYLGSLGNYVPSVNQRGWVIFGTSDNNVFKVKCNGDSLRQLTFNYITKDPKWDYTGLNYSYFQMAHNNVLAQVMRFKGDGSIINSLEIELPNMAVFKNSDKIIYQKVKDNTVTLVVRDLVAQKETPLVSGPFDPNIAYFDDLCLDNKDEYAYWSNAGGVYRCALNNPQTELVYANCANVKYYNPVFQKSRPNEMYMACEFIKQVSNFVLLHEFKAVEINMLTGEKKVIEVFRN